MSAAPSPAPCPFTPAIETRPPGEDKAQARIDRGMTYIQKKTFADYGHPVRAVHAKSHALLQGELLVLDSLPATLAQGLFARPATYPVVMRLSTTPGDILDDSFSTPRGMAIKVMEVEGARLPDSEGDRTQDFIMVNAPAFGAATPEAFALTVGPTAATTDTGQGWKKAISLAFRGIEAALDVVGLQSAALAGLGGHPATHPLGERFYSATPFRYGDHVAKLSLVPVSPELVALKDQGVKLLGRPNALREEAIAFFQHHAATWELRVQLRSNPETMPIEDASVVWAEAESPFVAVARITVPRQPAWSEARARQVDDCLSFNIWHGLAAHQPLGGVNRVRKHLYHRAADFRRARTGCPMDEPSGALALSPAPAMVYGTARGREGRRRNTPDAPRNAGAISRADIATALAGAVLGLAVGEALPSDRRAGRRGTSLLDAAVGAAAAVLIRRLAR